MLERTREHEQNNQQQQIQTQCTDVCHNLTLARKYFSSQDFALCADQEGWELSFSMFGLAFQVSGSYTGYVKYSVILNLLKCFFKKLSNHLRYLKENIVTSRSRCRNLQSRNLEEIMLNHRVILDSAD